MNTWTIYKAVCSVDGSVYVGQTQKHYLERAIQHRNDSASALSKLINAHGFDSISFSELAQCRSKADALHTEKVVIKQMVACGVNLMNSYHTNTRRPSKPFSDKTRELMSMAKMGKPNKRKRINTVYQFVHKHHGEVRCTRYELHERFGVSQPMLSMMCLGKIMSANGWKLGTQ